MAKFNEYPSKATPEDADTLMLYDSATKSNKLSPFSGIWNWILGKVNNRLEWNMAGIIAGSASSVDEATEEQKVTIPKNTKEIFIWLRMYRNSDGSTDSQIPFQVYDTKYVGGAEIITGGYYFSPTYNACFRIRIDNYTVWIHKQWVKLIENGKEVDNSAIVEAYVYYR